MNFWTCRCCISRTRRNHWCRNIATRTKWNYWWCQFHIQNCTRAKSNHCWYGYTVTLFRNLWEKRKFFQLQLDQPQHQTDHQQIWRNVSAQSLTPPNYRIKKNVTGTRNPATTMRNAQTSNDAARMIIAKALIARRLYYVRHFQKSIANKFFSCFPKVRPKNHCKLLKIFSKSQLFLIFSMPTWRKRQRYETGLSNIH